jgi:GPH family glycoside/pentoside/hexuronide:cation symporter/probable glucitol transport protein GutA
MSDIARIVEQKDGKEGQKLSFMSKVGFGLGEAGSQCSWGLISAYLTVFYTDVVGLTPGVIAIIMLIGRIWDGINDPMFGAIAENTTFKSGRYRIWILIGTPFLALFSALMFLSLDLSFVGKIVWCALMYLMVDLAYTVVNLSTGALANTITASPTERNVLQSFRGLAGSGMGIVLGAIVMPLILYFGKGSTSSPRGYFFAALILSLMSIPFFLICVGTTKEVIIPHKQVKEKKNVVKDLVFSFKVAFSDHDTRYLMLGIIANLIAMFGRMSIVAYYFIYVLKNPMIIAAAMTASMVAGVIANLYGPFVMKRFNKKSVGIFSNFTAILSYIALFVVGQMGIASAVVVISVIAGLINWGQPVQFSLVGDVIDDNWIRTGKRTDGITYSIISFSTKLGFAVGPSVGILALAAVGFVANTDMSREVLTGMNAVINLAPCLFMALGMFFFAKIRITNAIALANEKKVYELLQAEGDRPNEQ